MSAPTRRAVLAGLSAAGLTVPVLASLPVAANPDAELFERIREMKEAFDTWGVRLGRADELWIAGKEDLAAEAQSDAAREQFEKMLERVFRTPAKTAEGMCEKLRTLIWDNEGEAVTPALALILADAERIGGAS